MQGVLQNVGVDNIPHVEAAPTFLILPKPVSVNRMTANHGNGRIKSKEYRDWQQEAGWKLKAQNPKPVRGRFFLSIGVERGNLRADIDNLAKSIVDLLVKYKVVDDDRNLVAFCMAWNPPGEGRARVLIMKAANYSFDFQLADDGATGGWFLNAPMEGPDGH